MADPGIGTRPCQCDAPRCERDGCQDKATNGGSIDLLTALDLLGKAEARVAELEAALEQLLAVETPNGLRSGAGAQVAAMRTIARAALAAVRQEKP
jgi:hypothetical protein